MKRGALRRLFLVTVIAFYGLGNAATAWAVVWSSATLTQSDPRPNSSTVTNTLTANVSGSLIRCIKVQFSTSTASFTAVTGITTTSATINASSTLINSSTAGWTLVTSTNGQLTYTNATGINPATLTGATFRIDNITNGTTAGTTYYFIVNTYSDAACSLNVDNVSVAFVYTAGQLTTVNVDATLIFTVTGVATSGTVNGATTNITTTATTIPLGKPTTVTNSIGAQDLAVTTNAGTGYTTYIRYTAPPTSGSNTIADTSGINSAPTAFPAAGNEAFGYTTNDFTLGTGTAGRFSANKWAAFTTTNAEVAYDPAPQTAQTTRVGFQVGVSVLTKAGNYITTVIYTVVPSF